MAEFRLSELAAAVEGQLDGDGDTVITGAGGLESASTGDVTFLSDERRGGELESTAASAVVLRPGTKTELPAIRTADPYGAFAVILDLFAVPEERIFGSGRHPSAVVAESARLGEQVTLGPHVVIGEDVVVGDGSRLAAGVVVEAGAEIGGGCRLHARVFVGHDCRLGSGVILQPGVVIGADGFGYLPGEKGLRKIPQIGRVVVGDAVEIGANACIDRATTGETVIGAGTKIDNLVQIAHNVAVGSHCALSAQTGLSGSSRIGNAVTMGGQVGVGDHLSIGDGAMIGGKSGVTRDIEAGRKVFGYPAQEFTRAFRRFAVIRKLPDLLARVRRLEKTLEEIQDVEEEQT